MKVVVKPWGRELWLVVEKEYAGKILEVKKGKRLSLQYHEVKKESMYVLSGHGEFTVGGDVFELKEGDNVTITINPREVHRVKALSDLRIIEISTPHLDDVVRVEDDYRR
ncbi:MAG: cupin domain-containing protein [Candidatus Altiarchaeales archaeon]|nr:cupin domain-containing protein [Candidatus Altiarchaeales archaeon]